MITLAPKKNKPTYLQILKAAKQLKPAEQQRLSVALLEASSVKIVRPIGTAASVRRGQRLAKQIKAKLSSSVTETLDETMSRLRGRSWS